MQQRMSKLIFPLFYLRVLRERLTLKCPNFHSPAFQVCNTNQTSVIRSWLCVTYSYDWDQNIVIKADWSAEGYFAFSQDDMYAQPELHPLINSETWVDFNFPDDLFLYKNWFWIILLCFKLWLCCLPFIFILYNPCSTWKKCVVPEYNNFHAK